MQRVPMASARESMAPCDYAQSSRKKDFPIGMRVLVFVDEDRESLGVLGALLMQCGYQVTTAEHGNAALELLRKNKGNYDLVISDFQMHEMDGFKHLEIIDVELELPVILLSTNDETSHVRKGLLHGAADVLLKPVKIEELKLIWKNVIRNDRNSLRNKKGSNNAKENEELPNEERKPLWSDSNGEQQHKKRRVSWSIDLHTRFVDAVNQLGIDKATPKRILKIMNIEGLTQFNIASHLQKYRRSLTNNCIGLDQQAYGTRLMDKDSGFNDSAHSTLPCSSMEGGTRGDTFNDTGHSEFRSIQPMDSPIESALPDFTGSDPDAILIQSQVNKFFNQDSWQDGGVLYELWINSCRSSDAVPVEQWKDACQGSEITFEQPIDACRGGNAVTAEQWTNVCPGGGVPVGQWTNGCQSNDWQTVEQWTDACGIPAGQWTDGCFGGSGVPMGHRDSDGALGGQQTDGSLCGPSISLI